MYVCMYGWMDGWMDGCMYVCMYVYRFVPLKPSAFSNLINPPIMVLLTFAPHTVRKTREDIALLTVALRRRFDNSRLINCAPVTLLPVLGKLSVHNPF